MHTFTIWYKLSTIQEEDGQLVLYAVVDVWLTFVQFSALIPNPEMYALPPRVLVLYETTHLPVTAIAPSHLDQSPCSIARWCRENEQLTAMPRTVSLYVHLHTCDCTSSLHSGVFTVPCSLQTEGESSR